MSVARLRQTPHGSVAERLSAAAGTDRRSASTRRRQASARREAVRARRGAAPSAAPAAPPGGAFVSGAPPLDAAGAASALSAAADRLERQWCSPDESQRDLLLRQRRASEDEGNVSVCLWSLQSASFELVAPALRYSALLMRRHARDEEATPVALCEGVVGAVLQHLDCALRAGGAATDALWMACRARPALFDALAGRLPRDALLAVVARAGVPSVAHAAALLEPLLESLLAAGAAGAAGVAGAAVASEACCMSLVQMAVHFTCSDDLAMRAVRALFSREDSREFACEMLVPMVAASEASARLALDYVGPLFELATRPFDQDLRASALAALSSFLKWPPCAASILNPASLKVLSLCLQAPYFQVRRESLQCIRNAFETCPVRILFLAENMGIFSQICDWVSSKCSHDALLAIDTLHVSLFRTSFDKRPASMCIHSALTRKLHSSGALEKIADACRSMHMEVSQRACVLLHGFFFEYCEAEKFSDQEGA
jgi:hypothetical protein